MKTMANNRYYKIIDNETGELECYVKANLPIKAEKLCEILGIADEFYAEEITEKEYRDNNED